MANATTAVSFADKVKAIQLSIVEMFGVPILSGGWVNLDEDERKAFSNAFLSLAGKDGALSKLSSKFNQQVWDGWDNGTLTEPVKDAKGKILTWGYEGTRDRRDPNGAKPGRKAAPKTAAEILFGLTEED